MPEHRSYDHHGALPAHARHAMAATADAHATRAAVGALQDGGGVVDAAIAAAFALCVTQPGMCGLGGGGHLLARFADGRMLCLDFRERAPLRASADMYRALPRGSSGAGWLASATPGTVSGLGEAHRLAGKLPWAALVEPAIALAEQGHAVSYLRSRMLAASDVLREDPESQRILLRGGDCFRPGEILRQQELARTLRRLARDGAAEFYCGETARTLARAMAERGGMIDEHDLASYACVARRPLEGTFRGREVWTMPPSSAGGIGLLQIIGILDGTPFAWDGPASGSYFHWLAEAMRRSFADRAVSIGDSESGDAAERLLDPRRLARMRESIDPRRATPSAGPAGMPAPSESVCTTHISVLDREGNAAALTFTLNGMYGSGVTVPGLGFLLNNNMDNFAVFPGEPNRYGLVQGEVNAIGAGRRPVSSMTPTIVCRDGSPEIVIGTPGGPTIVTAVAQALLYMLAFGWNPREAVDQPRIHHQWLPDLVYAERGVSPDAIRALEARGHRVECRPSRNDMNAIVRQGEWLEGAADCRREGHAAGF